VIVSARDDCGRFIGACEAARSASAGTSQLALSDGTRLHCAMGSLTGIRANLLSKGQHPPARSALGEISPAMIDCGIEPECGSDECAFLRAGALGQLPPRATHPARSARPRRRSRRVSPCRCYPRCASQTKSAPPRGGRGFLRTQLLGVVPAQAVGIPAQEWTLIGIRIVARRLPPGIARINRR
jgi:hypothetical protein